MAENNNDERHRTTSLHVVMFPWLAFGHMIPFLELSKNLAQRGHTISFISTPRNIQRILPKIPTHLSNLYNFISLPLPQLDDNDVYRLPEGAEATTDLPHNKIQYLKKAFDRLDLPFTNFLETSTTSSHPPHWIIHDFAHHWLPPIAAKFDIPCAYLSVFNASSLSFYGPPIALMGEDGGSRTTPESFTVPPKWVPFPSDVVFRPFEAAKAFDIEENASGVSDSYRFGLMLLNSDAVFVRSCIEFEGEWFDLLQKEVYKKPIVQMGSLLSSSLPQENEEEEEDEKWVVMREWLEKQKEGSVVYVALGSEAALSQEGMKELALGLESSELPFFWVIRKPNGLSETNLTGTELPDGFEERTKGRGFICKGWVPQMKILGHPSVGCFLTHCGWGSTTEGLVMGKVLVLMPMLYDQGLVARLIHGRKIGLEVPRDELDGSFTRDSVTKTLKSAMVGDESESFKAKAKEMKEIFGDKNRQNKYVDDLEGFMKDYVDANNKANVSINGITGQMVNGKTYANSSNDVEVNGKPECDSSIHDVKVNGKSDAISSTNTNVNDNTDPISRTKMHVNDSTKAICSTKTNVNGKTKAISSTDKKANGKAEDDSSSNVVKHPLGAV